MDELQQPLLDSQHTIPVPAPVEEMDLGEALEPVDDILKESQPLLDSQHTTSVPAPVEENDSREAIEPVDDGLKESQPPIDENSVIFGESQPGEGDWMKESQQPIDENNVMFGESQPGEDDWMKEMEQHPGDSWAGDVGESETKGFPENSWDTAFADGFDDDGFLDEDGLLEDSAQPTQDISSTQSASKAAAYTSSQSHPYAPLPSHPSTPSQILPAVSPFAPAPPLQPSRSNQGQSLAMKFFEDLPDTQSSRSRRPKQQVVQPLGAAPPPSYTPQSNQAVPPPRQPSAPPQHSAYNLQLQPPQKLDLFPPQPTRSPDGQAYTQKAAPPAQQSSLQPQPPSTSRYSPAPAASVSPSSKYANVPTPSGPAPSSRYSLAPPQPPVPQKDTPSYFPPQVQNAQSTPLQPQRDPPAAPQRQSSSRYSPAPSQNTGAQSITTASSSSSNHSPIDNTTGPPLTSPPPSLASHRFAPRTSSPLAQPGTRPQLDRSTTAPGSSPLQPSQEPVPTKPSSTAINRISLIPPPQTQTPIFEPPKRPRTQSPERQSARIYSSDVPADRRASLQETTKPSSAAAPVTTSQTQAPTRPRGPSAPDNVEFIPPTDPLQTNDPLQRWKGCPLVHWSSGSHMVTHFPKRDLRFGGGRTAPACKCSPNDLKISKIREQMPIEHSLESFPGPLKSKSKKKDLLTWLSNQVETLQQDSNAASMDSMNPRMSERLLLWKVMRIFIEHDGALAGHPAVDMTVKQVLVPPAEDPVSGHHSRSASSVTALGQPDATNPFAVAEVRRLLMAGDREKAVWYAVDNRLWGHAMLISSTGEAPLWKQVAQEFVRSEVRSSGADRKSLAAFYSIMAQNWDESADELVPVSARAGFQMMSTADSRGQSQSGLEGLNKWQETLSLVVGNRSPQDEYGLIALGKLLRDYGRIEAAHVCCLFAPSLVRLGGLDDPEAHITLLGADLAKDGANDLDTVLLTEVYEFGLLLRTSTGTQAIPHLQAYKLHHAQALADAGYRNEANQYCDSIATAIKSMTRSSPYYHPALIDRLEDLTLRLSQTPKEGSSWISKPTVGKVSGSMWAKFNSFVAGDDDNAFNGSAQPDQDAGPFARVSGGTPTISRNVSHGDLSSFTPMSAPPTAPANSSRYAPAYPGSADTIKSHQPSPYAPSMPSSTPRDIPKPGQNYTSPPTRNETLGASASTSGYNPYHPGNQLGISDNASQASSSYDLPILHHPGLSGEQYFGSPSTTFSDRGTSSHGLPHEDMPPIEEEAGAPYGSNTGPQINGFEATGGYAPPAGDTGYVPYEPPPDSPKDRVKPKKKSFMDDDGDDEFTNRAASFQNGQSLKTREPSEEVRKAAEADAERDRQAKEAKKSGGWFNWFGSKKDPNAPVVHRAKLGEESSFYFDPEQKRWINKKAPDTIQSTSSTPPPPKAKPAPTSAPPPGFGLAPPSRSATPAQSDTSGGSGEGPLPTPGVGAGPPSNPPSRPPTSMSNNSAVDEMMAPGTRRAGGAKKGKKRQVASVLS